MGVHLSENAYTNQGFQKAGLPFITLNLNLSQVLFCAEKSTDPVKSVHISVCQQ